MHFSSVLWVKSPPLWSICWIIIHSNGIITNLVIACNRYEYLKSRYCKLETIFEYWDNLALSIYTVSNMVLYYCIMVSIKVSLFYCKGLVGYLKSQFSSCITLYGRTRKLETCPCFYQSSLSLDICRAYIMTYCTVFLAVHLTWEVKKGGEDWTCLA